MKTRSVTVIAATLVLSASLSAESRCSLPHYPVAVGDVNEYRMTSFQYDANGGELGTNETLYSEEVIEIGDGFFRTRSSTDGNTSESKWLCTAEGLSVELAEMPPGMSVEATGASVPAKMAVGDEWTQTFKMVGEGFSQNMVTVNRVTKLEEIGIEAGMYKAFRVDYEIETTAAGQAPSILRGSVWYAPGAGLVKSSSTVTMEEGEVRKVESIIELVRRTTK